MKDFDTWNEKKMNEIRSVATILNLCPNLFCPWANCWTGMCNVEINKIDRKKEAVALLSQIRVIDTRRLVEKVGFLDKEVFNKLKKTLKDML